VIDDFIHLLVALLLPPLVLGVITRTKAVAAGRTGAPLLQPYFDLAKLWRKQMVVSRTTSWVFRAGPVVGVATAALAVLIVPLGGHRGPLSFEGDFILLAYLFGLARFFTVAAALDTGSAFEGMGGAREATFSCLAEPALFFGLLVLGHGGGSLSLGDMLGARLPAAWGTSAASLVLVIVSLFIVLLAESSRVPVDDPNTHLELTMIHEVMVLDHSGPALAMILYGAALKLLVLGAIVVRVAIPFAGPAPLGWLVFVAGMLGLGVAIGVVESVMARLRMVQVPALLVAACLLSGFGIVLLAR
jgi:formate hydrogenlyase subunit 4